MHAADFERDLEISAIDKGVELYNKAVEGRPHSELTPERRYIAAGMDTLVPAIADLQEQWLNGGVFVGGCKWGPYLSGLEPKKLALAILSVMFDEAHSRNTYSYVCTVVGRQVNMLRQFEMIRQEDNKYFHKVMRRTKKMNEYRFKLMKKHYKQPFKRMKPNENLIVGAKCCELAIEYTKLFEYVRFMKQGKYKTQVLLDPVVREGIQKQHEELSILKPHWLPMVVEPLPWTSETEGGYYLLETTAVKVMIGESPHEVREWRKPKLGPFLESLNTLQATKWRILHNNADILREIVRNGGDRAGVPSSTRQRLKPKPADFDENVESRKAWLRDASDVYSHNAELVGKMQMITGQLSTVSEFKRIKQEHGFDELYYVWDGDFRYRMYPRSVQLSPHASDTGRGLLEFADGVPLGEHGYKWLTIGLANALDQGKISFDDRVQYVHDHEAEIERWVADPLQNTGWMNKDYDCFQALALAQEWVHARKDKEGFVSHQPISLDGTCNGLQHFSALGRDLAGATYTNLLDAPAPYSMYLVVANAAREIVAEACKHQPPKDENGEMSPCFVWKDRINKKVVKTPTMTTPYGVTAFGVIDQLYAAVKNDDLPGNNQRNMIYMRDVVRESLAETVVSAYEIMEWLKKAAKACVKAKQPIRWEAPNGLRVQQQYLNYARSKVYTAFQQITWLNPENVDQRQPHSLYRNVNGLSPNFVHNLDAVHLMMTMQKAKALGIRDFRMIHDSFAVHAGYTERFKPLINEAFVELHRQPILESFKEQIEAQTGEKLDPLPDKGALNIEDVLKSTYIFN